MSTNYLALATLYEKINVEVSGNALAQSKALEAERKLLMSYSGFAEDGDTKNSKKGSKVSDKLGKCKICRLTSPKFYQLVMNDIPLIICLPFAYVFNLMDTVNVGVAALMTLTDLICMLVYLSYDTDLRFDTTFVYNLSEARLLEKEPTMEKLMSEQISI